MACKAEELDCFSWMVFGLVPINRFIRSADMGLTQTTDQDRAEFEAWAISCGADLTPAGFGLYAKIETESAWQAWQTARRAPVVPVETLETEYASCLAQCRDAFPVPDVNTELEGLWAAAMGCPLSVPEYIKAIAAAPQPPEANPVELHQIKTAPVECACGDSYPADSFGAGFIAASGKCPNCDAAEVAPVQMPEPDFYGFRDYGECRINMCFTPQSCRDDGSFATAYYTEHQVRQLLAQHGIK